MKKFVLLIFVVLFMIYVSNVKSKDNTSNIKIPNNAIRLRVVANSNIELDQMVKMKLSMEIQKEIEKLLKDTRNLKEAKTIINDNMDVLNLKVSKILQQENYNIDYKITFGNTFFPEKKYKGILYEQGEYDTLLITLGKGEGNNWWCVLFPPLCLMEAEENNVGEVEYKFFIKELLDKYL